MVTPFHIWIFSSFVFSRVRCVVIIPNNPPLGGANFFGPFVWLFRSRTYSLALHVRLFRVGPSDTHTSTHHTRRISGKSIAPNCEPSSLLVGHTLTHDERARLAVRAVCSSACVRAFVCENRSAYGFPAEIYLICFRNLTRIAIIGAVLSIRTIRVIRRQRTSSENGCPPPPSNPPPTHKTPRGKRTPLTHTL